MKSKIFKGVILASAIAFINCGDDSATSPLSSTGDISSSSIESTAESSSSDDKCLASSLPNACGDAPVSSSDIAPTSSSEIAPASSSDEAPASSADALSSSSDVQSSSGDVASSSSEAQSSSSSEKSPESSSAKVESSSSAEAPKGIFLASGKEEEKDQLKVVYKTNTGWDNKGILAYPEQLSNDQKHAVVVWGPGGGTEPGAYGGIIRRLASHGFVVIALRESPGNATQAIPALNWLEKKNKDPNDALYQKLDMTKVGCSGHSMGGLESEQALIKDDRVITAMLNNSGDLGHTAMSQVSTSKTIGIVYGEGGMERPNAEADYNNQGVKAPACLIKMTGGQGNECQQGECGWGHGSGPWGGMAATVAWMRWHLGGEDNRKADFVGSSGKYINGPIVGERGNWKGQCKNF